jgi:hypothetical protein
VRIEKPGTYKTLSGLKAEVTEIRGDHAIGWIHREGTAQPAAWLVVNARIWNGWNSDQLVSEWRDPVQQTVTFALVERQSGPEVVWERNIGGSRVLATKTITITEGEGMSTAGEKSPDL